MKVKESNSLEQWDPSGDCPVVEQCSQGSAGMRCALDYEWEYVGRFPMWEVWWFMNTNFDCATGRLGWGEHVMGHTMEEAVKNWKRVLDLLLLCNLKLSLNKTFCFLLLFPTPFLLIHINWSLPYYCQGLRQITLKLLISKESKNKSNSSKEIWSMS